ncbi:MAG: hypothetical protein Q4D62_13285 [Planctomycetia bacterium]|nr:hypothetical protein [Planctomycetia bacterium]
MTNFERSEWPDFVKGGHSIRFELEAVKAWLKSRYKSGTCEMILE